MYIWTKGIPWKISFFLWRVLVRRIATDDNLKWMNINVVSRYWCFNVKNEESMSHLFQAVCYFCRDKHGKYAPTKINYCLVKAKSLS